MVAVVVCQSAVPNGCCRLTQVREATNHERRQVLLSNISYRVAVRLACHEPNREFVAGLTPSTH